mgnify:CR=1 FL=1
MRQIQLLEDMKNSNTKQAMTDQERMGDEAFDKAVNEYWKKELAKTQRPVYYLPSAQRGAESLIGPLNN